MPECTNMLQCHSTTTRGSRVYMVLAVSVGFCYVSTTGIFYPHIRRRPPSTAILCHTHHPAGAKKSLICGSPTVLHGASQHNLHQAFHQGSRVALAALAGSANHYDLTQTALICPVLAQSVTQQQRGIVARQFVKSTGRNTHARGNLPPRLQ
jgi:hypothetical protein